VSAPTTGRPAGQPAGPGPGGGRGRGLLRDKRVVYGGAAVLAVAVVALYRRPKAGSGSDAEGTGAGSGAGTTGTDIAGMLSDYNAQNQRAMAEYVDQVQTLVDSSKAGTPTSPPSSSSPSPVTSSPKPAAKPKAKAHMAKVGSGNKNETVGKLMARWNLTLGQVRKLNPALAKAGRNTKLAAGTSWRVG
jgi:hypothetical protein